MINLLIVDDEPGIREGLSLLDWESIGISVCGICENGLSAYKKICDSEVDIVLTDIRMPVMDGIELVSSIHREFPGISAVVLSGYDEFEYVKKCLANDVRDYVLKPIDKGELLSAVKRAAEHTEAKRKQQDKINILERKNIIATKTVRRDFFRKLFSREMTEEEVEEGVFFCEFVFDSQSYRIACFILDDRTARDYKPNVWNLIGIGIEKILNEYCEKNDIGYVYVDYETNSGYILFTDEDMVENNKKLRVELQHIKAKLSSLKGIMRTTLSCGVGGVHENLASVFVSAHQAKIAAGLGKEGDRFVMYDEQVFESKEDDIASQKYIIQNAIEFMHRNYNKNIALSDVAKNVSVNHAYLSFLFKKVTGSKFIDYLTNIRIEKAKQLLMNPHYKVYEVSNIVGYSNPRYFSFVFKKIAGVTPYEFRSGM